MEQPYLPFYAAQQLHTLVRSFTGPSDPAPVLHGAIVGFSDEPFGQAIASARIVKETQEDMPLVASVEDAFVYAWIVRPDCCFLVGPVRFSEEIFLSHVLTLEELGLPEDAISADWLKSVPICTSFTFTSQVLLLFNIRRSGRDDAPFLFRDQFFSSNCVEKEHILRGRKNLVSRYFDHLEAGIVHNPYSQELRERRSIQNGDIEGLLRAVREDFTGEYGKLSSDPLRQEINMGIVTITIASRAAIDGGLHQEIAFSISDATMQQMERATDILSVRHIYRNAEYHLAELVRDLRNERKKDTPVQENRHISKCKDYIFAHLHEKLTVREVSDAVGLDTSYLSGLFSRCEHISMKQYIMNEKIKLARNMLSYSTYSFIAIASYLGFSSQSHLGSEFKKVTGMTLKSYRDTYGIAESAQEFPDSGYPLRGHELHSHS